MSMIPFKRLLLYLFLVLGLFGFTQKIYAEEINRYHVSVDVNKDGTIHVQEDIRYDFGANKKHGILRTLPFVKTNSDGKKFVLRFTDFEVSSGGGSVQFSQSQGGENLQLKVGDPDQTVTGLVPYTISYRVSGAITYFSDHDELYWNAIGTGWSVPILESSVEVALPGAFSESDVRLACFTGPLGSTQRECRKEYRGNKASAASEIQLSGSEGLTIVVGFPRNVVSVLEPEPYIKFTDSQLGRALVVIFSVLLFLVGIFWYGGLPLYIIYRWWQYGRDPVSPIGVASVWFSPPKAPNKRELTPAETGTLVDEFVDMRDITATIIDLARRGHLRLRQEAKNDFFLIKTDTTKDAAFLPFEETLLSELFKGGGMLKIKGSNLYDAIEEVKKQIYEHVTRLGLFPENPEKVRLIYMGLAFMGLVTGNMPLAIISFVFGRAMPKKTPYGAEAANVGRALKNFITSQEKQYRFQAKEVYLFEKLLPYAIAFGVEKIWADRFKSLSIPSPSWYQGYGSAPLTATYLVSSLDASLSSFSRAATPTRSSSGFSSGFGGGGSSGGGGGGGGGGSW